MTSHRILTAAPGRHHVYPFSFILSCTWLKHLHIRLDHFDNGDRAGTLNGPSYPSWDSVGYILATLKTCASEEYLPYLRTITFDALSPHAEQSPTCILQEYSTIVEEALFALPGLDTICWTRSTGLTSDEHFTLLIEDAQTAQVALPRLADNIVFPESNEHGPRCGSPTALYPSY